MLVWRVGKMMVAGEGGWGVSSLLISEGVIPPSTPLCACMTTYDVVVMVLLVVECNSTCVDVCFYM